jgi:hypothetical protein
MSWRSVSSPVMSRRKHHADQAHHLQQVALEVGLGHDPRAQGRHEARQQRGPEEDARQDLADDRGLFQALRQLPEESGRGQEDRDLKHQGQHIPVRSGGERVQTRLRAGGGRAVDFGRDPGRAQHTAVAAAR